MPIGKSEWARFGSRKNVGENLWVSIRTVVRGRPAEP
jgi:hypothetical protein